MSTNKINPEKELEAGNYVSLTGAGTTTEQEHINKQVAQATRKMSKFKKREEHGSSEGLNASCDSEIVAIEELVIECIKIDKPPYNLTTYVLPVPEMGAHRSLKNMKENFLNLSVLAALILIFDAAAAINAIVGPSAGRYGAIGADWLGYAVNCYGFFLTAATLVLSCCVIQCVATILFLNRLPEEELTVMMYYRKTAARSVATSTAALIIGVLFSVIGVGFAIYIIYGVPLLVIICILCFPIFGYNFYDVRKQFYLIRSIKDQVRLIREKKQ